MNDFDNEQYLKRISNEVSVEPDVKPATVTEHNSLEIIRFMNTRWPQHKPFEKLLVGYKIQLWWKRRWFRTLHFAITRSMKYIKRAYTIPLAQGDQTCACLLNMFTYRHTIFHSRINYKQIIFYSPFCFRIGVFGGKIVWRSLVLSLRTCNAVWVSQSQRVTDRSLVLYLQQHRGVVSAADATPTERWLNVWCVWQWHPKVEPLQECRVSGRRVCRVL